MTPAAAPIAPAANACAHCGQLLLHSGLEGADGAAFCCEGCREVHGLLAGDRWRPYRDLMELQGRKAPRAFLGESDRARIAAFRDPAAVAGLGRWRDRLHGVPLRSRDFTCAGCGYLVENLADGMPGVRSCRTDFLHGTAWLEYDADATTLADVLEGYARFGYRLEPDEDPDAPAPIADRALLYRIAVAGFCFANSMAFAAAVYLGWFSGMPEAWARGFGIAGFAVALPAALYSAQPFYAGAWRAWRTKRFNVDSTVTLGLLVAFAASAHAALSGRGGNFSDSLSGLVFFLLIGRWAVRRFEAGLSLEGRWFEKLSPDRVSLRRADGLVRVPVAEADAGDVAEVAAGAYVPVDGILEVEEAWMDTSLLTGESRAARLRFGDRVFAGYLNLKGKVGIRLSAPGAATRAAALKRDLAALAAGKAPLADGAGKVAARFTLAVALCAVAAFAWHFRSGWEAALSASASVFVISCSCALALAAPINRGLGLKRARELGFHFRAQAALDALRGVRCVLFDKTGTLTFTRRAVSAWDWQGAWRGESRAQESVLGELRALTAGSLHPVSLSLRTTLEPLPRDGMRALEAREIPHFGMAGSVASGEAARRICLCKFGAWNDPAGAFYELGLDIPGASLPAADSCVFIDGRLAALIRFTEEIRPEAVRVTAELKRRGIAVALLSGDNPGKVRAFAEACGISEWRAALSPEAKRNEAEAYRKRYGMTLAVGDGFNDSLLFGSSDMAMAVAGGAADRLEGVDILAAGDKPAALANLFALADAVSRGTRLSYLASGLYNTGAIAAAFAGLVTPLFAAILMPLSGFSLCLIAWAMMPSRVGKETQ